MKMVSHYKVHGVSNKNVAEEYCGSILFTQIGVYYHVHGVPNKSVSNERIMD